jgi:hypothetical protein
VLRVFENQQLLKSASYRGENSMQSGDAEEKHGLDKDWSLVLAEYNALRSEILKHMDIQNQLGTFNIIVFGTIAGIGFQNKIALLMLLYPTLAMFLSIGWSHADYRAREIGLYIKKHIESAVGTNNIGWEHYLAANPRAVYYWATRGTFITTELLAIIIGISIAPFNSTFLAVLVGQSITNPNLAVNAFIVIAIVSLFITIFLLRQVRIGHGSVQYPLKPRL